MHLCSLFCRIVAELMRKLAESRLMIDDNSKAAVGLLGKLSNCPTSSSAYCSII